MSDIARLKRLMERAEKGETLTIGFLGGSITQGSLAGTHENTYAYRVFTWWKNRFPKAKFRYVNGGIGGTSSYFGVARAHRDLLMYRPDFVADSLRGKQERGDDYGSKNDKSVVSIRNIGGL